MNILSIILGLGMLAEAGLFVLLALKHVYRKLPMFFLYAGWGLLSDVGMFCLNLYCSPQLYARIYCVQLVLDSAMMFAVLVELAWSLLRPIRFALPRYGWVVIGGLVALLGVLVWPVAGLERPPYLSSSSAFLFHLQQAFALLRVVFFLLLAGCSQLFSIGWRDRELQVATGLGTYSLISLLVTILHTHQMVGPEYHWLDVLGGLSYMAVLVYWVISFAMQEAERRPFTPQMRNFLLAAAGAAHMSRISIQSSLHDGNGPDHS